MVSKPIRFGALLIVLMVVLFGSIIEVSYAKEMFIDAKCWTEYGKDGNRLTVCLRVWKVVENDPKYDF